MRDLREGDVRPIGVFDSGLGGLTMVREFVKYLPGENIVYFGDTGRVPYGSRSPETIAQYARQDESFLLSQDVKMIIAACGTVSSVASHTGAGLPVPFIEVVSPAARAAAKLSKTGRIGVIGTSATISSGSYARQLQALRPDQSVIPGLYVTGDNASNWMGEEYGPMFSSFCWAMNSGYLAGEEAAAYVSQA